MTNVTSKIASYRSNFLNNVLEGAAVLQYHRNNIVDFFQSYHNTTNLKQQNVYADAKCDNSDIFNLFRNNVFQSDWTILELGEESCEIPRSL